ncbi:microsomal triglyceride transfer protein-like isoform X1 [Tympanuchus pallidicinctus]|uniref:microsomal triglyceride transfer protein-like isoform X1 n=2 Tax=Tympanuchus pallidicinctus TaxID=109042 RepID=UPI0022874813|nr:microsomal triglyceride transfer protein-like isoform X1 [Tympanuchus pallidicinctus]
MEWWALGGYICLLCFSFLSTARGSPWMLSFQPGTLYYYHYALALQLGPVAGLSPSGGWLQAQAVVKIHQLHRNPSRDDLLQLQIQDLKAQQEPEGAGGPPMDIALNKKLQSDLEKPVFISWSSGKIKALYGDETESTLVTNLKRGVISLLQLQAHTGTIVEEDASGSCQVTYTVSNHSIVKTKDLLSCTKPKMGYASVNKMFGIQWQPYSRSLYVVKHSLLQSVLAEESHTLSLVLRSTTGVKISSRQELKLVSSTSSPSEAAEQSLENMLAGMEGQHQPLAIASLPFRRSCTHCPSLRAYLKTFDSRRVKMDISKAATTWQFQRFIQMLRGAKKRDVLQLLKRAPEETLPFMVEAAVAAQSVPALAALSDFLDFSKKPRSLLETFLYAAAFSPRPTKELLRLVLDKLDGKQMVPEVRDTGMVALGSLVGKLCRQQLCGLQEVEHSLETILTGLRSAEKEHEAVTHLLALGNTQLPSTIPTLLEHAEKGPTAVAAAAISSLRQFPAQHITSEVKRAMRKIFHEKRKSYEKTCRLAAAEILLDNTPLPMDVINILLAAHQLGTEAATFLLLKVQSSLRANHHPARKIMNDIMRDPQINNYYHFSKAGISSSFSGPLTATKELLSTFGLDLLFLESGFLRKSVSDFSLLSHDWHLRAAQVTIEAQGMESMLGENTLEGEEGPELMAGMSAIFFDVQLRPIVFFQGYTDLMAKVLLSSGEPTSVVRGNLLLMDHHQVIPLQSGLQAVVKLQGGLGLDISANVDVNIWEQELKTSVNTRGSLTIDFQTELDAPFLQTTLRSQIEAETSIYFDTILRFSSSPVLMCLQLREGQVPYREIFTISTFAGNQSSTVRKGRQGTMPAREFALHQANSNMCHLLLMAEEGV